MKLTKIQLKRIIKEELARVLNENGVGAAMWPTDPETVDAAGDPVYSRAHEVDLRDPRAILEKTETMLVEMGNWISSELRKDGGGDAELLQDLKKYVERLAGMNDVLSRKHYQ